VRFDPLSRLMNLLKADPLGQNISEILNNALEDPSKRNVLVAILEKLRDDTAPAEYRPSSPVEQILVHIVEEQGEVSTSEVMKLGPGYGYKSLSHQQHANSALNLAVRNQLLGKLRKPNGVVKYSGPRESILEALKSIQKLPRDCEPRDLIEVTKITGLDINLVSDILEQMRNGQ